MSRYEEFMRTSLEAQIAVARQAEKYGYAYSSCNYRYTPSEFTGEEKWGYTELVLAKGKRKIEVSMAWQHNEEKGWHCVNMFVDGAPSSDSWAENPTVFSFHTPAGAVAVLKQFFNDWQCALVKVG